MSAMASTDIYSHAIPDLAAQDHVLNLTDGETAKLEGIEAGVLIQPTKLADTEDDNASIPSSDSSSESHSGSSIQQYLPDTEQDTAVTPISEFHSENVKLTGSEDGISLQQSELLVDTKSDSAGVSQNNSPSESLRSLILDQSKKIIDLEQKVRELLKWRETALIPASPTSSTQGTSTPTEIVIVDPAIRSVSENIIKLIVKYGCHVAIDDTNYVGFWQGKTKFLPIVERQVMTRNPIRMVMPAFPCKSPNAKDKVLGRLPDLGEEVALAHLQGMCDSIADIYEHGAEICLASDGLVYNELLGVSDDDVWSYGEALRIMAQEKGFNSIKFYRLVELLDHAPPVTSTGAHRHELIARFANPSFDWRRAIRESQDVALTYKGYLKFLSEDMRYQPRMDGLTGKRYKGAIEAIAQKMIVNGNAFANAVEHKFGDCVRLSIHPSSGKTKLSVPLIPQNPTNIGRTPWHSCIAVGIDGSFQTVHAADVRDTHELVYRNGRPYYFREKSELYEWAPLEVEFEHLYPQGLVVRPKPGSPQPSLRDVNMKKVRGLSQVQSPVVIRGFADTCDRDIYSSKAYEAGEVQLWTFGLIQEVKDQGRVDKNHNNVVSNEAMPMHYDGMFKFVAETDENGVEVQKQKPPKFQYFTCPATAPSGTGYTLFASSRLFFKYLPQPYSVERLEKVKWGMENDGFWNAHLKSLPLVVRHPVLNTPCMRWHEPWPASKTKFSTCDVTIENDTQDMKAVIDDLLYDRRVCLRFQWEKGDILVSDNTAMLHTRTAFTGNCDRELWRIHFD